MWLSVCWRTCWLKHCRSLSLAAWEGPSLTAPPLNLKVIPPHPAPALFPQSALCGHPTFLRSLLPSAGSPRRALLGSCTPEHTGPCGQPARSSPQQAFVEGAERVYRETQENKQEGERQPTEFL